MADLTPEVEQQLASLSDGDWAALTARVRAPDTTEQLRAAVAKHVSADQLDSIMSITNTAAFVRDGQIDEALVQRHFGNLFGASAPRQWGQSTGSPPGARPGDAGRAAAQKRHGVGNITDGPPQSDSGIRPGQRARAEIERRYGKKGKR